MSYTNPVLYPLQLAKHFLEGPWPSSLSRVDKRGQLCILHAAVHTIDTILPKEFHWTGKQYNMWTNGVILTKHS